MTFPTGAVALALAFTVLTPAYGGSQQPVPVQRTDSGAVFDFQDADLRVVIAALAEVAGLNIVYANLPARAVTLRTSRAVTPDQVRGLLENVLRANNLDLLEQNGVLRIVAAGPTDEATAGALGARGQRAPAAGRPEARLFVHRLRHTRAEPLAQTLRALFGLGASAVPGREEAGRASLSEALRAQRLAPYQPGDAPEPAAGQAPDADRSRREGLPAGLLGAVELVPDPVNNAILILASPADYETMRAAIEQLDIRPLQVLIEVLIAEVRHSRDFALGMDARLPLREGGDTSALLTFRGRSAGDLVLKVLGIGSVKADVVLQALASSGNVTILSRPVVLAQNNQQARILVGDQRPFIQLFRSLPTDAAVRDQVVQYRDVGTQLSIRPTINTDGYVSLSVLQEVNTATAESQFGAPVINTREAETQLLVKDGHTVVIGGLIDHQRETTTSGVPLLKDLPLLGLLFRSTQQRTVANELFILLTPHVLYNDEDTDDATRRLRQAAPGLDRRLPDSIPLFAPRDSVRP